MTSTNTLGIRNGNQIIPYGAATKQTKVITTTDTSMLVLAGTGITQTACSGYFMAYADSAGKWRLRFNVRASGTTSGAARALATIVFSSTYAVKFKNDFYQAVSGNDDTGNLTILAYAQPNTANIGMGFPSATSVPAYVVSGDVELESEPTWAAANMEGAVNASVYIAEATSTSAGLLSSYEEYDGTTAACTGAITSNGSWKLTKIGKVVTVRLRALVASASSATSFVFGTTIPTRFRPIGDSAIPIQVMSNGVYVMGVCLIAASTGIITVYAGVNFTNLYSGNSGIDYHQTVSWLTI